MDTPNHWTRGSKEKVRLYLYILLICVIYSAINIHLLVYFRIFPYIIHAILVTIGAIGVFLSSMLRTKAKLENRRFSKEIEYEARDFFDEVWAILEENRFKVYRPEVEDKEPFSVIPQELIVIEKNDMELVMEIIIISEMKTRIVLNPVIERNKEIILEIVLIVDSLS